MTTWSFYNAGSGLFVGKVFRGSLETLAQNNPDGFLAMEGEYDHLSKRVDLATGGIVEYVPPQPANTPENTWSWSAPIKRWTASKTNVAIAIEVRAERYRRLVVCDWVVLQALEQNIPVASSWVLYRQQLRDIPLQPGFPLNVVWPVSP